MTRAEAIDLLARHDWAQLSPEQRQELLCDWWTLEANDPDYATLPKPLREAMAHTDHPGDSPDALYDPLVLVALRRDYVGTVNAYLSNQIAALGHPESVEGTPEALAECPCCGYRSLPRRGEYEICRVCFWEDDGTTEPDQVSDPNHLTLRQARRNFERFGAVCEEARAHVLTDGRQRYAANNT